MIEIKNRFKSVTDRGEWAARGSSFVAKVKATKMVWFPPGPVGPGRESARPFAQESNLLSCPRRVKDFFQKVPLPGPAPRLAVRSPTRCRPFRAPPRQKA